MKAHAFQAERASGNDLLTLELAYKHDPIIIALINQVRESYAIYETESDTISEQESKIDGLEGDIAELKEQIDDMERGITEAVAALGAIREFKKAEMVENITEIMAELEALKCQ